MDNVLSFSYCTHGYRAYAINDWREGVSFYEFYLNKDGYGDLHFCFGCKVKSFDEIEETLRYCLREYTFVCDGDEE